MPLIAIRADHAASSGVSPKAGARRHFAMTRRPPSASRTADPDGIVLTASPIATRRVTDRDIASELEIAPGDPGCAFWSAPARRRAMWPPATARVLVDGMASVKVRGLPRQVFSRDPTNAAAVACEEGTATALLLLDIVVGVAGATTS
jgi:hypothetical protein